MKNRTKIISLAKISSKLKELKNKKTVLVGGCFDIFHYGHLQFLKKAKKSGNFLIVVLESDEFIKKNKGRQPIHTQKQRAEILSSFDFVDLVVLLPYFNKDIDYFNLVKKIRPKIIAVSSSDPKIQNKKKQAAMVGAKVKQVTPLIKNFSSTKIYKKYAAFFSD